MFIRDLSFASICLIFCLFSFGLVACAPTVYLIDRQTVLELEASGEWQELDQKFREQSLRAGPLPLEKTRDRQERRQVLGMTHGDDATVSSKAGR